MSKLTLKQVMQEAVIPAYGILGARYNTVEASLMLLAIGGQESKFASRQQIIMKDGKLQAVGPAVSFWQQERGGGIAGTLTHHSSASLASKLCKARGVEATPAAVWEAMKKDDVLGAGMARLLVLTDPFRLPAIGQSDAAWKLYTRVWRPGKPHPAEWQGNYDAARAALGVL